MVGIFFLLSVMLLSSWMILDFPLPACQVRQIVTLSLLRRNVVGVKWNIKCNVIAITDAMKMSMLISL